MTLQYYDLSKKKPKNWYWIPHFGKNRRYPSFALIDGNVFSSGPRYMIYQPNDPITEEMEEWLEENFPQEYYKERPYEFVKSLYIVTHRIGVAFHRQEDAVWFMLIFVGEN